MSNPDHHEVLNISREASATEIVQAYRAAISAYETDSLAAYSLFGEADLEKLRHEAKEAYRALSLIEKHRACDI